MKAISTYKTYFMISNDGQTYEKLIDIIDFPQLGEPAEAIDVTTLSDPARCYIQGILDPGGNMPFRANYTLADYTKIKALVGTERHFALWFGATTAGAVDTPTGVNGKFIFDGYVDVTLDGNGVNEAVGMTLQVTPTTAITEVTGA